MDRRGFLAGALGAGVAGCAFVPVIPARPSVDAAAAAGWIAFRNGAYVLILPRAEMGQGVADGLKAVACAELSAAWDAVRIEPQDTEAMAPVAATVGSVSVKDYAIPLAQACAALRDAVAAGGAEGPVRVAERPVATLRAFSGQLSPPPRRDAHAAIVTGAPLFAADLRLPGMLHGRVLRAPASPEARSAPATWDLAAAQAVPGFVAVVEDEALAFGRGQGLGVVARSPGALERAVAALAVTWRIEDTPRQDIAAALDADRRLAGGRLPQRLRADRIDDTAPWDVDLRLDVEAAAHGAIEPRAAVACVDRGGVEVWTGSQDVFYVRDVLRRALGRREVRVHGWRIGGGFGGRTICTVENEAAVLARATAAPVKVQWTRAQELMQGFHRPPVAHRVRVRLSEGRIADWSHGFVSGHVLFTSAVLPVWLQAVTDLAAGDAGAARGAIPPYALPRARIDHDLVRLPVHTGPWRGLGAGPNALAVEMTMDAAAAAAGADPLAFRLAHVEDPRLAAVLLRVADMAGWPAPPAQRRGARVGRGLACGFYKGESYAAVVADVAVDDSGRVKVTGLWCAHECGMVIDPDQVAAQCEGNMIWSLGLVLSDRLPVTGGVVTAESFAEAPIPTMADAPPMAVALVTSDAAPTGAGETAMIAAPGAIANAVAAATGVRAARFPIDADVLRIA